MDTASGTEFGALFWGYHDDGVKKIWADEEPRLVDSTSDEMKDAIARSRNGISH